MYFKPPTGNNPQNPFYHHLNQRMNEEVKTFDKKKAKDIYDKLKKGSEIQVAFGNSFTSGGKPITLKVTNGHRVVGASKVGRIILVNKENPSGMKYKLFDRNGSVSLAQGDMGTILRDMKIVKEGVEELDEATKKQNGEKVKEVLTSAKVPHSMVMGTIRVPERFVRIAKEKLDDAFGGMFQKKTGFKVSGTMKEDVQLDEKFEFQFSDKETAQKFMREVLQGKLGPSTGTRDGKVTTEVKGDPMKVAKIMRKYGGKLIKTTEGPQTAKVFKEDVQLDETVETMFKGFDMEQRVFTAKLKKFGFDKQYRKMMQSFMKHANVGDGFYFIDGGRQLGFEVHPVADMMMGPKVKKLGDKQDLGGGKTVTLIAIKN